MVADDGGKPRLRITGLGLLTPLGTSAWATMRALLDGRTITDCLDRPDSDPEFAPDEFKLARTAGSIPEVRHAPGDPSIALAERAIHEAIESAGLAAADLKTMPVVVASSKGAMMALLSPLTSLEAAARSPHGFLCERVRSRLGATSCEASVAACASGLAALARGARILRRGLARRVAVVAVETALHPLLLASYRRLGVLPPLTLDGYRCRPLTRRRCGFTLTETAAAVVLERDGAAPFTDRARPPRYDIELLGVRLAAEAHHLIHAPAKPGALPHLARWAFHSFGPIDMVHPHATATVDNDETELAALADAMSASRASDVPAYAVKGALGHGLGASAMASLVVAAMISRTRRLPPMPWLSDPIDSPFPLRREGAAGDWRTHALFTAGFGGHVGACVIRAHSRSD